MTRKLAWKVLVIAAAALGCGSTNAPGDGGPGGSGATGGQAGSAGAAGAAGAGAGSSGHAGTGGVTGGAGGSAGTGDSGGGVSTGGTAGGGATGTGGTAGMGGTAGGGATGSGGTAGGGATGTGGSGGSPWSGLAPCAMFGGAPSSAVSFSPDGVSVAMGGVRPALYDPNTGAFKVNFLGLDGPAVDVKFSPDGTLLAASTTVQAYGPTPIDVVVVWHVSDRSVAWTMSGSASVNQLAFSPDGTLLAIAGDDKAVRLVNAATGVPVASYTGHTNPVTSVAFSPDGSLVASGDRIAALGQTRMVDVFRVDDLSTVWSFTAANDVRGVAFTPDGAQLLMWGASGTQAVSWKMSDGSKGQPAPSGPFVYAPDGQSYFGGTAVWRTSDNTLYRSIPSSLGSTETIIAAAYSPDGVRIILMPDRSTSPAYQAVSWAWSDGALHATFPGDRVDTTFAGVSPDGTRVLFGPKMYALPDGTPVTGYNGAPADHGGAFSPDGTLVASALAGSVLLQTASTGAVQQTLSGDPALVTALAFSPDGTMLASGGQGYNVKIWSLPSGALLWTLGGINGHSGAVSNVAWSPDSKVLVSTGKDSKSILWQIPGGAIVRTVPSVGQGVVSPDGQWLLTAPPPLQVTPTTTGVAQLSDMATGTQQRQFVGQLNFITGAEAFSPDGSVAASSDQWATMVWSTSGLTTVQAIPYPGFPGANWATFTNDGLLLGVINTAGSNNTGGPNIGWATYWCRH